MNKSIIINLLLALLIIGLYTYLNQKPVEQEINTLTTLTPDDIEHITITQANATKLRIQKEGSQWQINTPFNAPANLTRVQLLLSLLSQKVGGQLHITPQQDLSSFGFDKHSLSLRLNQATFTFGHIDPIHHHRYIRYQDSLYLLEDTIYPLLNSAATNFIDNHLFETHIDFSALTLPMTEDGKISPNKITLNKMNGQWQSQPQRSADTLMAVVDAWQYAQAMQVVPISLLKQISESNTSSVVTINAGQQQQQFDITLTPRGVMIINRKKGLAYQFPSSIYQQLLLPIE